ncbi:MAG: MBOAT family protein [Lachnospiraceae bacterium]|nr:MBOAT family protein [Lachnospiraceae bacterium]
MVFSSPIFLFAFLPVIFCLYYIFPTNISIKNGLLIIGSLLFYAFGEPVYVFLMIGSAGVNYLFGRLLGKENLAGAHSLFFRKILLCLAVILNIGVLCVFKYSGFIMAGIYQIFHVAAPVPQIALPVGISFFTFQALSYVIDVYRDGKTEQKNFLKLLLYISFFPQLIAGPIIRYHDISKQMEERSINVEKIMFGMQRFTKGLSKKLFLANTLGYIADTVFSLDITSYHLLVAWLGAISYTLQIYYDFSGYSDMAIGLAAMFGFEFKENFEHPYSACGIKDFWRKWHISLSAWFREYVYIPLGGNRTEKWKTERNKIIVFLLTGIWHGANWTFVIWGMIHGIANILEDTFWSVKKCEAKVIRNIYTWLIVIVAFVMFRADTVTNGFMMMKAMFLNVTMNRASVSLLKEQMNPYNLTMLGIAFLFSYPISRKVKQKFKDQEKGYNFVLWGGSLCLLLLCMLNLASTSYNPFIYFRF